MATGDHDTARNPGEFYTPPPGFRAGDAADFLRDIGADPGPLADIARHLGRIADALEAVARHHTAPVATVATPETPEQVDAKAQPLSSLRLPALPHRLLTEYRIATVGDLCQWTADELCSIRQFGKTCLASVQKSLNGLGLQLARFPVGITSPEGLARCAAWLSLGTDAYGVTTFLRSLTVAELLRTPWDQVTVTPSHHKWDLWRALCERGITLPGTPRNGPSPLEGLAPPTA